MVFKTITLSDKNMMNNLGINLFRSCRKGDIITLSGEMGTGKTTLARGFIKEASNVDYVPSPTYTLIQTYDSKIGEIIHFDAWRINNPEEIFELGIIENFGISIILIEWPEKILKFIPDEHLNINIKFKGNYRSAVFSGTGLWEKRLFYINI